MDTLVQRLRERKRESYEEVKSTIECSTVVELLSIDNTCIMSFIMPSPRSLAPESEHRPACLPAWDLERHMAFEMELVGTCTAFLSPTRHVQAI